MLNVQGIVQYLTNKPYVAQRQPAAQPATSSSAAYSRDRYTGTSASQYTVQPGDSLANIAYRFHVPLSQLLAMNPQLTQGAHRRQDGTLIFPGDSVRLRAIPQAGPSVQDQIKQAESQVEQAQQAAAQLAQLQQQAQDAYTQQMAQAKAQLAAQQAQAAKQQALAQTKFQIASLPTPDRWTSLKQAQDSLAKGDALLAKLPKDDADYAALAALVQAGHDALDGMQQQNDGFANKYDGQTKDGIEHLTAAQIAVATPAQKASQIRNLVKWDNADKQSQSTILAILTDAKRQGQLDDTLSALHDKSRKVLGFIPDHHFMTSELPMVMSDQNLDAYQSLIAGTSQTDFLTAIDDERSRRAAQANGEE